MVVLFPVKLEIQINFVILNRILRYLVLSFGIQLL